MAQQQQQKFLGIFWENYDTLPLNDQEHQQCDLNHLANIFMKFTKLFQSSTVDIVEIFTKNENQLDEIFLERIQHSGFSHHFIKNDSTENILTQILFWLWDSERNQKFASSPPHLIVVTNSLTTISLLQKIKSRGVYVVIISNLPYAEVKNEVLASSSAFVDIKELIVRGTPLEDDGVDSAIREIIIFSTPEDEIAFTSVPAVKESEPQLAAVASSASPPKISPTAANHSVDSEKPQFQYPPATQSNSQPQSQTQSQPFPLPLPQSQPASVTIPTGIPATWSEHLQQQKQQGAKPTPSLPSLIAKNETPSHTGYYDPHSGKPVYPGPTTRQLPPPPGSYAPPPTYGQPHDIPSPSPIDIAASGGFWSTLQKQPPQQQWNEPAPANPAPTEALTKEQRVLHDDLVTAIYAYNVNAAVSTLRKMYTKQTRTFRIPTVLGILLPDTAAMIVDGRTDLLNVAVCFALDSIQWCFGVQKGENIESFKYKMNANIARWILHETVKKGIPSTPTPVIQEATISVVNHILENVVELEFAWEMLTTLNISHPVQRIVPHVLAWRGYPNPSIEARVNDFLYDHVEIGSIIPPSNANPNMHMPPPQPPSMQFRTGGPVSPTGASTSIPPSGADRANHLVQTFLRDQQRLHQGMDYPMNPHLPNQSPNPLSPEGHDDPMMDRNMMKLMGRTQSGEIPPRMSPMYRDEYGESMRIRGMEGGAPGQANDKLYRVKGANPSPNSQSNMRGRYPGEPPASSHMDFPLNDEYPMHHHSFANPPRDEVFGRPQGPPSSANASREFPGRGNSFSSGKDLHHFDQDYSDGIPLEADDYLASLGRPPTEEDRSYMFGQQNFDFTLSKES